MALALGGLSGQSGINCLRHENANTTQPGDGSTSRKSAAYPPAGSITVNVNALSGQVERSRTGAQYSISNILMVFDTSKVPDLSTVTRVQLEVYVAGLKNDDGRQINVEWYNPGTIDATDYSDTAAATAGTFTFAAFPLGGRSTLELSNPTSASKIGTTGLRFHMSGVQPVGKNSLVLYLFGNMPAIPAPRMIVHFRQ